MGAMSLLFYNQRNFTDPNTGAKSWEVAEFIINWNKEHYMQGSNFPYGAKLTEDETELVSTLSPDIVTFISENYLLFATQERSLSGWDDYVRAVYDVGLDKVEEVYQTAYDRYINS